MKKLLILAFSLMMPSLKADQQHQRHTLKEILVAIFAFKNKSKTPLLNIVDNAAKRAKNNGAANRQEEIEKVIEALDEVVDFSKLNSKETPDIEIEQEEFEVFTEELVGYLQARLSFLRNGIRLHVNNLKEKHSLPTKELEESEIVLGSLDQLDFLLSIIDWAPKAKGLKSWVFKKFTNYNELEAVLRNIFKELKAEQENPKEYLEMDEAINILKQKFFSGIKISETSSASDKEFEDTEVENISNGVSENRAEKMASEFLDDIKVAAEKTNELWSNAIRSMINEDSADVQELVSLIYDVILELNFVKTKLLESIEVISKRYKHNHKNVNATLKKTKNLVIKAEFIRAILIMSLTYKFYPFNKFRQSLGYNN